MNIEFKKNIIFFSILILILNACVPNKGGIGMKDKKFGKFKHNEPLIKDDVRALGKKQIQKSVDMGPIPVEGNITKLQKRKKISSVKQKNYLLIPDESKLLKQNVSFKFQNLDYKEAMGLMARVGDVNILVGEEVAGAITAELKNVPWDKAFNALLDMKNFAADIDVASNIIRVHSPSTLTAQESYKSARAAAVKKKVELEDSVEPIISEIFRLYYISPAEAKATITELFTTAATGESYSPIQVTEEKTTRSIIVRGKEKDLDVVDKVIREIDVRTKQVLIEAFIVEANSNFERSLGTRLGGAYNRKGKRIGGIAGSGSNSTTDFGETAQALQNSADAISDYSTPTSFLKNPTSGIGILRQTGSAVLKAEITALERLGMGKTISNPKVFTLDNQVATITQGEEVPYESTSSSGTATQFKEAALKMTVTPSIIGDGNVLLEIQVNNDTPNRTVSGTPGMFKMEVSTKLLIADGDIVVIGGIKKHTVSDKKDQMPGIGDIPIIGNMFKAKDKKDDMNELLIFIAPRIL